jgi:alkylation response protein AidB-like acyl-CoA dehydrogenase
MSTGVSTDAARLIEVARDLGPTITALRDDIERERRLPIELVATLRKLGFFDLWLARDFGGPELSQTDYARVVEVLARHDSSVGWCVSTNAAYSRFSGFLSEPVARRIFVDERAVIAGNMGPLGKAKVVPEGYEVNGRWPYGSGISHSEWLLGGCVVHQGDGPRRGSDGAVETTIAFFPAHEAKVIDTWDAGGLRGTASHDYEVTGLFVPASHTCSGRSPLLPGPLYALPHHTAFCVPIAAVPLGIARAALDAACTLSGAKTGRIGATLLRDKPVVQSAMGRAEAMLCAARAFLFEACEEAWRALANGAELSPEQRARVRLACAQIADTVKAVVEITYDIGGGTSVYESCPLQRCFRDAHAAVQHVQVQSGNFETCGRVLLGLEPGTAIF